MAVYKPEPVQGEGDTISITRLLQAVWKRILWVIAAVVIGVAAAAIITKFFITPQYQASCWLYVNNYSSVSSTQGEISSAQLQASIQLATSYAELLYSETVLNDVSGALDGDYSAQQLSSMISVSVVDETQILVVTVTSTDPEEAARVANAVAQVTPSSIQTLVEGSSVTVPQYASVPTSPSSPSTSRNLMMGFAVGLLIGVGAALVASFLDTRITQQDNLSEMFGYPLLGIIPNIGSSAGINYSAQHASDKTGRE